MNLIHTFFFAAIFGVYCTIFVNQERLYKEKIPTLHAVPPHDLLEVASGYLRQVVSEIIFIKSAVFLGTRQAVVDENFNAQNLAHNYKQITTLYPEFIDPYYYTQSYLPHISSELAEKANEILENARIAAPDNLIYPFFQGVNYFRFMNEPLKAAQVFREASNHPDAPPMFERLAIIFTAQGGQLEAALISLQVLLKNTDDEIVRERYKDEIMMFQDAIKVQQAVEKYKIDNGSYPKDLNELVPNYVDKLPSLDNQYILTWNPPNVGLSRPK